MATITRGSSDQVLDSLKGALEEYERANTGAKADLYRQNSASVRIRVIDQQFQGMSKPRRHDQVWDFLAARVSDDVLQDVSVLLLLAPGEQKNSFMNFEFDDPIPSGF